MKKLKQSATAKVVAVILFVALAGSALLCFTAALFVSDYDGYTLPRDEYMQNVLSRRGQRYTYDLLDTLSWTETEPENIKTEAGFVFRLYDSDKKLVYDGVQGRETVWTSEYRKLFTYADAGSGSTEAASTGIGYVRGSILADPSTYGDELSLINNIFLRAYELSGALPVACAVCALLSVALFIFLMAAAGHKKDGALRESFLERIPFDILTVIAAAAVVVSGCIIAEMLNSMSYRFLFIGSFIILLCLAAAGTVALVWCMSFAVHIKLHNTLKSCLCWRILMWCWKTVKKPFCMLRPVIAGLPLIPKAALVVAAIVLVEFIWIANCSRDGILFGWFVERAVLVLLTLYVLLCMKKILIAGRQIAGGDMNCKIDSGKMYGPFREHAEDLNNITEGMNAAVNERMKSERLRTELITNVSHDIKTPLTSIINYVDLLEKEQPENEKMRGYIDVLTRQSVRLKKLIEDLMEASKAATGSISVNPERCCLNVLVEQMAGEYAEKLRDKELALVVGKPDNSVTVMADGRHMWRIFDNLLNNICKYAQRGTRVYLDLERRDKRAEVIFRNISAERLSQNADELSERFVRGDSSRSTEGSGLGLSIAQSLVKLQNGDMNITVDGDLFKVTLSFPAID